MRKWILIGVVIVIVIVIMLVLGISIGPLIKTAANTYGPGIAKTDMRLEEVGFRYFPEKLSSKGFISVTLRGSSHQKP